MSEHAEDPRCPECGEPIGKRATYCMHCSADLSEREKIGDTDGDGVWEGTESSDGERTTDHGSVSSGSDGTGGFTDALGVSTDGVSKGDEQLLDPDGLADNTLTVVVGIVGGIVVGLIGTIVLAAVTGGSGVTLPFGFVAWLGATSYLVRRRTVQGALAKSGYAVALVLLLIPVIALSPFVSVEGGLAERGGMFVALLFFVAVPASIAAAVGWIASRFVPEGRNTEG